MSNRVDEFKAKLRGELERRQIPHDTIAHYRNLKQKHVFWVRVVIPGGTVQAEIELDSLDDPTVMEHLARDAYRLAQKYRGAA